MKMKKLSPLYTAIVILVLCCLSRVSKTESLRGLRMLQGSKATLTPDAKNQTMNDEETEYFYSGSMGVELNDYPGSGANNRHSPHSQGTR